MNINMILDFIKKNLQYLMIFSIIAGFSIVYFWGGFDISKKVLVFIVVVFVIYPVMINTRFEEIFEHFTEPRPIFCSLVINFVFSPLIAVFLGNIFLTNQPELFSALLLIALIPSSSMSVAWTSFSGARVATALYLIPLNLLFSAFIGLPLLFPSIMGDLVVVNKTAFIKNIGLVFFVPLLIGAISRHLIIKTKGNQWFQDQVKPKLGGVSGLGVLLLIFLVMSLKRNTVLIENTALIFLITLPVALFYIFLYLSSYGWTKLLIRKNSMPGSKAVVIIYTSVARHINIAIAITLSTFPLDASAVMMLLLIIAYIIQVPSLAFFSQKFGKSLVADNEPNF